MAPKVAQKEKAVKGDEAEEMVLNYLKETNRPYASTDVSANLKNRVPKPAAQKIMAALAEKGSLTVKPYGKQTIYVYNQSQLDVLAPEELASLDEELKTTKAELEDKKKELRSLQLDLANKESKPKTKDLNAEIQRIKAENEITLKALLPFRGAADGSSAIKPMSASDTKRIDDEFTKWRKEWVARKKVYKELIGMFSDGGQISNVAGFEDDQGITPDDEDAKEVEDGEFCKLPIRALPAKNKQATKAAPTTSAAAAPAKAPSSKAQSKAQASRATSASAKRTETPEASLSLSASQSSEEPPAKKKKGKK